MPLSKIFIIVLGVLALSGRVKRIADALKQKNLEIIKVEILFIGIIIAILSIIIIVLPKL